MLHSLQFKLSILVLLFGLILMMSWATRQNIKEIENQIQLLRSDAAASSTRLAGLAQHAIRRNLPSVVDLELSYIAARRELTLGVVTDSKNNLLHVSDRQWQHQTLESSPLVDAKATADQVRLAMNSAILEDQEAIFAIAPFLMGATMQEKGVVVLGYGKRDILDRIKRRTMEESIRFSAVLLGCCLLLWIALNQMVTTRVNTVVSQAEKVGSQDSTFEPIPGNDEFSLISKAFSRSLELRRQLWHQQQPLLKLVENLRDVFWSVNIQQFHDWYVNPAFEKLFGISMLDLKKNRLAWMRVLQKDDRLRAIQNLRQLALGNPIDDQRFRIFTPQGDRRILCRSFFVLDESAQVRSIAGLVIDITEAHDINRKLAEAAETERRRIGWDLHDDLCQRLVAALFRSNSVTYQLKQKEPEHPQIQMLQNLITELNEAIQLARGLARGLAPVMKGGGGLEPAFEQLGLYLEKTFAVKVEIAIYPNMVPLQAEASAHLYRIAQELATNAIKHGKATKIELAMSPHGKNLGLEIRSNGSPFSGFPQSSDPKKASGMGVHIIQQRLDILGARLSFRASSDEDPWNHAFCSIPLDELIEPNPTPQTT